MNLYESAIKYKPVYIKFMSHFHIPFHRRTLNRIIIRSWINHYLILDLMIILLSHQEVRT